MPKFIATLFFLAQLAAAESPRCGGEAAEHPKDGSIGMQASVGYEESSLELSMTMRDWHNDDASEGTPCSNGVLCGKERPRGPEEASLPYPSRKVSKSCRLYRYPHWFELYGAVGGDIFHGTDTTYVTLSPIAPTFTFLMWAAANEGYGWGAVFLAAIAAIPSVPFVRIELREGYPELGLYQRHQFDIAMSTKGDADLSWREKLEAGIYAGPRQVRLKGGIYRSFSPNEHLRSMGYQAGVNIMFSYQN